MCLVNKEMHRSCLSMKSNDSKQFQHYLQAATTRGIRLIGIFPSKHSPLTNDVKFFNIMVIMQRVTNLL